MKKPYMFIILVSSIIGMIIGYILKVDTQYENNIVNKDKATYRNIKLLNKDIKKLIIEKDKLEKEMNSINRENIDEKSIITIEKLKRDSSYTQENEKGIQITIDAVNEEIGNIANFIDYNKILIKLVNELKINGAEFISINNKRINQYTGIVLAGSHININSIPIAPPYIIDIIGNEDKLREYKEKGSSYINYIVDNYPIYIKLSNLKELTIPKLETENKLEYIRGE